MQKKDYLGFPDNRTDAMLDAAYAEYLRIQELNVYNLIQIKGTARDQVVQEYRDIFLTKNSEESIFEIQHDNTGNFSNANGHKLDRDAAAPYFGGTIAAFNPTQNHVDEYRMANGKRINEGGSDYDKNNPYEGRDIVSMQMCCTTVLCGTVMRWISITLLLTGNRLRG